MSYQQTEKGNRRQRTLAAADALKAAASPLGLVISHSYSKGSPSRYLFFAHQDGRQLTIKVRVSDHPPDVRHGELPDFDLKVHPIDGTFNLAPAIEHLRQRFDLP